MIGQSSVSDVVAEQPCFGNLAFSTATSMISQFDVISTATSMIGQFDAFVIDAG